MKEQFVKYKTYEGLNHTQCLVLSYIEGWGDKGTFSSNKHIGERLHISSRTVSRTLNEICEMGHIKIENPKGRGRNLIFNNIDNMSNNIDKLTTQHRQYVQHNIDNLSNNKKEDEKGDEIVYEIDTISDGEECIKNYLTSRGIEY